jgi:predicted transcriptional regulator
MLVFLGCHNQRKAMALLLLSQYPNLGYLQIASIVGSSPRSMSVLLKRWVQWRYVARGGLKHQYVYSLTSFGLEWLNKHLNEMPLDVWLKELGPECVPYYRKVYGIWLQRRGGR